LRQVKPLLYKTAALVGRRGSMSNSLNAKSDAFIIRFAEEKDSVTLVALIRELAKYENLLDKVNATKALVHESIFKQKVAEAIIGEYRGKAVAYAIFFHNFSTFNARLGIFIEDIYVKPHLRRKGFGKAMFNFLAKLTVERGCTRLEWACLDWNAPSIAFYKKLGADALMEWTMYRLSGESLAKAAEKFES
jgi:GNAT superfamily N-acetyltransferase